MVRTYADPVAVRSEGGSEPDGVPVTFLWRGRLYVVRTVLGHWRERRAWWTAATAAAEYGEFSSDRHHPERSQLDRSQYDRRSSVGEDRPGAGAAEPGEEQWARGPCGTALSEEHEVWRVEASRGLSFGVGVYDLSRDLAAPSSDQTGAWRLLRVAD